MATAVSFSPLHFKTSFCSSPHSQFSCSLRPAVILPVNTTLFLPLFHFQYLDYNDRVDFDFVFFLGFGEQLRGL